jgi:hypothetical protein
MCTIKVLEPDIKFTLAKSEFTPREGGIGAHVIKI